MGAPLPAASLEDLGRFLELGLSLVAVTRDEKMFPAIARCGGARLGRDGQLRVLIAMPEGAAALANLEANGMIALSCVQPTTYRTLQVKATDARRIEWPDQEAVALSHRPAFAAEVEALGLSASVSGRLWSEKFVTIAFTPTELFDQTPGPAAGLAVIA